MSNEKELPAVLADPYEVFNLLHKTESSDGEALLDMTIKLRLMALMELMKDPAMLRVDSKLAANVNSFINSLDKQTLTKIKLENDRESAATSNGNILDVFLAMVHQHGRNIVIGDGTTPKNKEPEEGGSIKLPEDEFTFNPGEMITGNDTEDSFNS